MGYSAVRSTLKAFFATIPTIQTMYSEAPWLITGRAFKLNAGTTAGAVGMIHLDSSSERRIALPWSTGQKLVETQAALIVLYQYMKPPGYATQVTEDAWVVDLDKFVDTIKAKLRSNQNAGDASVIFQLEGMDDVPHFLMEQDLPVDDGARIWELLRVSFPVYEIITA